MVRSPAFVQGIGNGAPSAPRRVGPWPALLVQDRHRYLQEEPLVPDDGGFAPVDDLGEGQLPAVAQQDRDAGRLEHREAENKDQREVRALARLT